MPTITLNKNYLLKLLNKKISDKELRTKDPELTSFFNVNTPSSLEEAKAIIQD